MGDNKKVKKIIGILVLVLAVLLIAGCDKNEENKNGKNNNINQSQTEEYTKTYENYIGKDIYGNQVKEMIDLILDHNEKNDDKLAVELSAFKGTRKSTSNNEKIRELKEYIGGQYSMFNISCEANSGDNTRIIVIKQTVGTREDPEVPEEKDETFMFDIFEGI